MGFKFKVKNPQKTRDKGVLMIFNLEVRAGSDVLDIFNMSLRTSMNGSRTVSFHNYLTPEGRVYEVVHPSNKNSKIRAKVTELAEEVYRGL